MENEIKESGLTAHKHLDAEESHNTEHGNERKKR